jgi:hypothetical protein
MATERVHIVFPAELVKEIDSLVGKRGRSKFLADVAASEVRRRNLLQFLDESFGCWKDRDHPELKRGSVAYIRRLRKEWDRRLRRSRG